MQQLRGFRFEEIRPITEMEGKKVRLNPNATSHGCRKRIPIQCNDFLRPFLGHPLTIIGYRFYEDPTGEKPPATDLGPNSYLIFQDKKGDRLMSAQLCCFFDSEAILKEVAKRMKKK